MDGSWIWAAEYNSLIPLLPASTLSPLTLRWPSTIFSCCSVPMATLNFIGHLEPSKVSFGPMQGYHGDRSVK